MIASVRKTGRLTCRWVFVGAALVSSVLACQVPVFRYALERWHADHYQILVLSDGVLTADQQAVLRPLVEIPESRRRADLKQVDVTKSNDAFLKALWQKHHADSQPLMVALYPDAATTLHHQTAHVTALAEQGVRRVLTSPARDEVARRLVDGQSAVWIFVESGDRAKDQAALQVLQLQLQQDAKWLKLPSVEELEVDPKVLTDAKIRLRIEFSVVSVRRDDPDEQFLLDCLLNSEPDLRDFDEPIAFPVFGRGRVLYALIGQGIAPETIRTATTFMAGPCSCQVKNQNPGFDLLLSHDWDAAVGDIFISEPLPAPESKPTLLTIPPGRKSR